MKKALEVAHAELSFLRRRRHEHRIAWARSTEPVPGSPKLAWHFVAAASVLQKDRVHLPQQPIRKREPFVQAPQTVCHRGDVPRDFLDVIELDAGRLTELVGQEIIQSGPGAFDLRRQHGFLALAGIEEQVDIWQRGSRAIQPADCQ